MPEYSSLPQEPWARRVLLLVDRIYLDRCEYDSKGGALRIPQGVLAIPHPLTEIQDPIIQRILRSGLAQPGAALIQNPVDTDLYYEAQEARMKAVIDKWVAFRSVCAALGATRAEILHQEEETDQGTVTWDGNGQYKVVKGRAKYEGGLGETFRSKFRICSDFSGGKADLEAAEAYASKTNLLDDFHVRDLIHIRSTRNPPQSEVLELNLAAEVQRNLTLLGEVSVPKFVGLKSELQAESKNKYSLTVTIKLQFS